MDKIKIENNKILIISAVVLILAWLSLIIVTQRYLYFNFIGNYDETLLISGIEINKVSEVSESFLKELEYSKSIQNNIQRLTLLMFIIPISLGSLVSEFQISQKIYLGLIVSFNLIFSILYDWLYLYPARQLGVKLELSMINSHLGFLFFMNMLGVGVISKKYFNKTLIFNAKLVTVIMMLELVEYLTWKLIITA